MMMNHAPTPGSMPGMPMNHAQMGSGHNHDGGTPSNGRSVPAPVTEPPPKVVEVVVSVSGMT